MNRDRSLPPLRQQIKNLLKLNKSNPGNLAPNKEFTLTDEVLRDLSRDAPTPLRLKTMKELSEPILANKLEAHGVEKLWYHIQDLFVKEQRDERHAAFAFLQCVIKGQFTSIDVMRAQFFRFIKDHHNPHDFAQRLELLAVLTNNGKSVQHFDEEIGPFLLNWKDQVNEAGKLHDYLEIVDNIIKFNSSQLDEAILTEFIRYVCHLCCHSDQYLVVALSLQIMGTVVAYSIIPIDILPHFVGTLCGTVNIKCYCRDSWKTMKFLLGTHMGHSALFTLTKYLKEESLSRNAELMRGCVFYVHMALWDINSMQNLCCPPSAVLPAILQVSKYNHPTVAFEVILGMQKLINKNGIELLEPSWNIVLEIISHINKQIELAPNEIPNSTTQATLHEILNTVENLIEVGNYKGSLKQFFHVIHECANERPGQSVFKLFNFYLKYDIRPTERSWLQNLYNMVCTYFKPDVRNFIRLKVITILHDLILLHGQYEDELIDRIVIPHMQNIHLDEDAVVRAEVARFLSNLCLDFTSNICTDILDILEKLLLQPYERFTPENPPQSKDDVCDVEDLVQGLVKVFSKKIHRLPSAHAIKIYKMFVKFLEKHFLQPYVFKNFTLCRTTILDCFLKMRADCLCHLGHPDPATEQLRYSSYLCVTYKSAESIFSSPLPSTPTISQLPHCKVTHLCMEDCFKLIISFLSEEKDWEVLKFVLDKLPNMLANKAIVLAKHTNPELNTFVITLCAMLDPRKSNLPEGLNTKVTRMEFQQATVSVIVCLASYSSSMDQFCQQMIINTLIRCTGTDPRCSRQSINALTVCMMDMREIMMKMLSDVLLRLSKISATTYIAMPILEFLSTLSQLPTVYGNFVGDQYMAVFAIALPYTNPFKYDTFIVSVAYHVISVWFLKCRLPFRKDFVKFIVSGLRTNVIVPYQELNQFKLNALNTLNSTLNQDSSDRKRSSSLTEPSSSSRRRAVAAAAATNTTTKAADAGQGGGGGQATKAANAAALVVQKSLRGDSYKINFYAELNETCMDLMARYTYSPCSALPTRLPTAEFLLRGGISKSWMLGNKLITITTSGCTEKVLKHGVCDKCWSLCSAQSNGKIVQYVRSNSGSNDNETAGQDGGGSALNRQSSNEKPDDSGSGKQHQAAPPDEFPKLQDDKLREMPICACWCQGWAEILVRRPTGNVSWIMKVQNSVSFKQIVHDFPLNELAALFMPELHCKPDSAVSIEEKEEEGAAVTLQTSSIPGSPTAKKALSRQSSRDSVDEEPTSEFVYDNEDGERKSRNPVRRSNSSPEMANWKNPFVLQHHKQDGCIGSGGDGGGGSGGDGFDEEGGKKNSKKDVRVSCEAIPEEIYGIGTSPPFEEPIGQTGSKELHKQQQPIQHPSLLTCHSYPGSSPPTESNIAPKPYKTVPPSPNFAQSTSAQQQQQQPPSFPSKSEAADTSSSVVAGSSAVIRDRPSNLPNLSNLLPGLVSGKPPQSPTQTSPRLPRRHPLVGGGVGAEKDSTGGGGGGGGGGIQKSSSSSKLEKNRGKNLSSGGGGSIDMSLMAGSFAEKRDRLHTISVMSTATRKSAAADKIRSMKKVPKEMLKSGLNPSFVFLQLYYTSTFGNPDKEEPLFVHSTVPIDRAISLLDRMYPYEIHKIGVLYVREGQAKSETDILSNTFGCTRYLEFLQNLGTLVRLKDVDQRTLFVGGVNTNGSDGDYMYTHQDDLVMLSFHVATMMPNKEHDPNCNSKKAHVGNDSVIVVYNNSGEPFDIYTFRSQVTLFYIIIEPLDYQCNRVTVKVKSELIKNLQKSDMNNKQDLAKIIGSDEPIIVSDQSVSIFVRQLAIHADEMCTHTVYHYRYFSSQLISMVMNSIRTNATDPYVSSWLERLRQLKNLREKVVQEIKKQKDVQIGFSDQKDFVEDFTDFT